MTLKDISHTFDYMFSKDNLSDTELKDRDAYYNAFWLREEKLMEYLIKLGNIFECRTNKKAHKWQKYSTLQVKIKIYSKNCKSKYIHPIEVKRTNHLGAWTTVEQNYNFCNCTFDDLVSLIFKIYLDMYDVFINAIIF